MPEIGLPKDVVIPQEKANTGPKLVRFVVNERTFRQEEARSLKRTAIIFTRISEMTSILYEFANQQLNKPDLNINIFFNKIRAWRNILDKVGGPLESPELDPLTSEDMRAFSEKIGLRNWPQGEVLDVVINSSKDAIDLEARHASSEIVLHDTRSPMSRIYGFTEATVEGLVESPIAATSIRGGLENLRSNAATCLKLLENPYPKESVTIDQFQARLEIKLRGTNISLISTGDHGGELSNRKVEWSNNWLESLAANIAQNISKAYRSAGEKIPKIAFLKIKIADNDTSRVQFIVEDWGPGLLFGFKGFKRGQTKWSNEQVQKESTGFGMHAHLVALKEHYGGNLTAENILSNDGHIIGARVIVEVPFTDATIKP